MGVTRQLPTDETWYLQGLPPVIRLTPPQPFAVGVLVAYLRQLPRVRGHKTWQQVVCMAPAPKPKSAKATPKNGLCACFYGAGRLNRTVDLPLTRRLLYHLSYAGKTKFRCTLAAAQPPCATTATKLKL